MDGLFFRRAIYRDSDLPARELELERDADDSLNIRVNGGANGLPHIRRGMSWRRFTRAVYRAPNKDR